MKKTCFIHSGRGRSLCSRHRREARTLAAKWHISEESAVFELRDFERDVEDARITLAQEFRNAMRTIGEGLRDKRLVLDLEAIQKLKAMLRVVNAISPRGKIRRARTTK